MHGTLETAQAGSKKTAALELQFLQVETQVEAAVLHRQAGRLRQADVGEGVAAGDRALQVEVGTERPAAGLVEVGPAGSHRHVVAVAVLGCFSGRTGEVVEPHEAEMHEAGLVLSSGLGPVAQLPGVLAGRPSAVVAPLSLAALLLPAMVAVHLVGVTALPAAAQPEAVRPAAAARSPALP